MPTTAALRLEVWPHARRGHVAIARCKRVQDTTKGDGYADRRTTDPSVRQYGYESH